MSERKVFTQAVYGYMQKEYVRIFDETMKVYHLTQTEIDVLAFLYNNPEYKRAKDIVDIRGITKAQASLSIDKLVKKGYLRREVDENNRRCYLLYVEDSAKEVLKQIVFQQMQFEKKIYKNMTDDEIEQFHQLLFKVYQNAREDE